MSKPQYPTIQKHADGGYVWTDCPECGPNVAIDEEGLCSGCGADAIHYGSDPARQQESEGVVVRAIELPDCRPILFIPDKLLGDDHYLVTRIEANDSSL